MVDQFEFANEFANQIAHIFPKVYKRTPYQFEFIHRYYDDYHHIKVYMDSPTIIRLHINIRRRRTIIVTSLQYDITDPSSMDQIEKTIKEEIERHQKYIDDKRNKRRKSSCHK